MILPKAGTWVLPKPFDGSVGCSLDTFLREYTDCLEVNGFVSVASGAFDTVDSASRDSMTRMALFILKRSLTGCPCQYTIGYGCVGDSDAPTSYF